MRKIKLFALAHSSEIARLDGINHMKTDSLKELMKDVVNKKTIEIENKQSSNNYYNLSYGHGVDKGFILLAEDILRLISLGEI